MKWDDVRYDTLADFVAATGLEAERHRGGRANLPGVFLTFRPHRRQSAPFQFMTLASGCNAIDAGVALPSINDDFHRKRPRSWCL